MKEKIDKIKTLINEYNKTKEERMKKRTRKQEECRWKQRMIMMEDTD